MAEGRFLSGYGSSESWGLVMAGGTDDGGFILATVATTDDGESFGSLPDLPDESERSCLAIIDDDRLFKCGGYPTYYDTLIFSKSTNSWSRHAMLEERLSNI